MKNIFIIAVFLFAVSSCANVLDVDSKINPTYTNSFKTEKDLEAITYQTHAILKHALAQSAIHYRLGEKMDYTGQDILNLRNLYPMSYSNTNTYADWEAHYNLVYMANLMIDNLHRTETVTQDRKDFHLAQALFVKGLAYFDLGRKWGDAVITKNSTTTTPYSKSSARDVIDEAIKNAHAAYDIIPVFEKLHDVVGTSIRSKQFGSKGAVAALLAHAYAWKASMTELYGWETALTPTQCRDSVLKYTSVLISGNAGNYSLETTPELLVTQSLRGTYNSAVAKEVIFEFDTDYDFVEYPSSFVPGYTLKMIGYPVKYGVSESSFRSEFDLQGNFCEPLLKNQTVREMYVGGDSRRNAFFYQFETQAQKPNSITGGCAYPYKWREEGTRPAPWGGVQASTLKANYVYWRLADILLLRAETYALTGDSPKAIIDLNTIRDRASAPKYSSEEGEIRMVVFREREKELLMEGHRYFDVVRNKLYATELMGTVGRGFSALTISDIKDGALYLPVHLYAFENNTTITQNRYWVKFMQN